MHYQDTWTKHIPPEKLAVYKQLRSSGTITNARATYARRSKITVVEYDSELSRPKLKTLMRTISEKAR